MRESYEKKAEVFLKNEVYNSFTYSYLAKFEKNNELSTFIQALRHRGQAREHMKPLRKEKEEK